MKNVLIKELSDDGLREHYFGLRALAYNGAAMRDPKLGRILRDLDITVAVARKRGVDLFGGSK